MMPGTATLIAGGRGQLGAELSRMLSGDSSMVHAPGSRELDVSDAEAVSDAVDSLSAAARDAGLRPVVINAAAFTAVDAAEEEPDRAATANSRGAAHLARACAAGGLPLLHMSTDYVFAGDADRPYEPDDPTGPKTVYGRTKLDGERSVLEVAPRSWVIRTAWVYGASGGNFVKTMARLESERETVSVVDDQFGSPTWTADLASGLVELSGRVAQRRGPASRVLHCTNSGSVSWYEFARAVFTELGADPERVRPCTTAEFPRPAPRPAYSVLSARVWSEEGLTPLRPWRESLTAAFAADAPRFRPAG